MFDLIPYAHRTQICVDSRNNWCDATSARISGRKGGHQLPVPSHDVTMEIRSALHGGGQERKLNPSALSAKRALGCGGVEDLHRDLLHTLLHGASRGKGWTQCGGHGIGRLRGDGPRGRAPRSPRNPAARAADQSWGGAV